MDIKIKIDMVFSPRLSYLKTDFGWVRNGGGSRPGTSQIATSKKEPKVYIFCEPNKYKRQTLGKYSSNPIKRLLRVFQELTQNFAQTSNFSITNMLESCQVRAL